MNLKTELQATGSRFGIEPAHGAHVAALSVELFDRFSPVPGSRKADRTLLEAAAYLHDIGYAAEPDNHIEAGVRILLENPVAFFPTKDWHMVVGTVLLHQRDWRAALGNELFSAMGAPRVERVKRLAAMLRIADGLDHGRLQDVRITGSRRGKKRDRIGVACGWYAGNMAWAESKADLWEAVFKRHLRIEGIAKQSKPCFKGVVLPKDSAIATLRRILHSQYDLMRDLLPGLRDDSVVDALHGFRVALRRFRTALKLVEPLLHDRQACQALEIKFGRLSDRLGPVRDAHVLLRLVQGMERDGLAEATFLETLEADVATANQSLHRIMASTAFGKTMQDAIRFLRIELPAAERMASSPPGFRKTMRDQLAGLLDEIRGGGHPAPDAVPELWHELRKRCRRARYIAEFAEPVFGKGMAKRTRTLREIAGALGDLRDAHNLCERLEAAGYDSRMLACLAALRQDGWARFEKSWRKLTGY